jgi:hypothetical protein
MRMRYRDFGYDAVCDGEVESFHLVSAWFERVSGVAQITCKMQVKACTIRSNACPSD